MCSFLNSNFQQLTSSFANVCIERFPSIIFFLPPGGDGKGYRAKERERTIVIVKIYIYIPCFLIVEDWKYRKQVRHTVLPL